jgi:hypothetical protein
MAFNIQMYALWLSAIFAGSIDTTNRTIELTGLFWLQGDAIIAAFKVEHTKAIYSELLRMSDQSECSSDIKINLLHGCPGPAPGDYLL